MDVNEYEADLLQLLDRAKMNNDKIRIEFYTRKIQILRETSRALDLSDMIIIQGVAAAMPNI